MVLPAAAVLSQFNPSAIIPGGLTAAEAAHLDQILMPQCVPTSGDNAVQRLTFEARKNIFFEYFRDPESLKSTIDRLPSSSEDPLLVLLRTLYEGKVEITAMKPEQTNWLYRLYQPLNEVIGKVIYLPPIHDVKRAEDRHNAIDGWRRHSGAHFSDREDELAALHRFVNPEKHMPKVTVHTPDQAAAHWLGVWGAGVSAPVLAAAIILAAKVHGSAPRLRQVSMTLRAAA